MKHPPAHILAILSLISALEEAFEESSEVEEHYDPDKILLLGTHPDGQAIGVCVPCTKSILQAMEESDKEFRQSKDDRLTEFTALTPCPNRKDRFHVVLR